MFSKVLEKPVSYYVLKYMWYICIHTHIEIVHIYFSIIFLLSLPYMFDNAHARNNRLPSKNIELPGREYLPLSSCSRGIQETPKHSWFPVRHEAKPYCWRHCTLLVTVLKETILSLTQKFPPRELSFIVSEGSVHSTKGEKKLQQWWDWQAVPNSTIIVFASCRQLIVVKLNLKPALLVRTHAWYCKPSQEPIARGAIEKTYSTILLIAI